jgi:hypothetical protein
MIKKILAFIPCYLFYFLGDLTSKIINKVPNLDKYKWVVYSLYNIYCGCMITSAWLNDFGGMTLWNSDSSKSSN